MTDIFVNHADFPRGKNGETSDVKAGGLKPGD